MKKIVFQIHELYHKSLYGAPNKFEVGYSMIPVMNGHNKPLEYDTYSEAEGWIDNHYAEAKGSSKLFQIQKIYKPAV